MPTRNDSARQSRRRSSSQPDETRPARTARSLITFVDSQDPNSRSAIQRHTAFHSNAQRRDARLQSLRNTSRPRLLEWQKRSDPEGLPMATSQTSSTSSSSISLIPTSDVRRVSQRPSPEVSDVREGTHISSERDHLRAPLQAAEQEELIAYLFTALCPYTEDLEAARDIIDFVLTDTTCTYFLVGYALFLRAHNRDSIDITVDCNRARELHAQGTTFLRNRLGEAANAASDESIQAVLLLIAYTADVRDLEDVAIHARALQTMVDQRGGIHEGIFPDALYKQLIMIHTSRFYHITLNCSAICPSHNRFPQGLYEL